MNDTPDQTANKDEPRWRSFRSLLINVALVIAVFLVVTVFKTRNMLTTDGEPAPGLHGKTLAGEFYDLGEAAARPVLIYFFAPWCKICAVSANNLVRLRRWRDVEDLEIVAVALDWQSEEEVRDYAERHELNIPVVLGTPDTARRWQVYGFPSYYVLDGNHRIAYRDIGYSSQLGLWWRTRAVEAFAESM